MQYRYSSPEKAVQLIKSNQINYKAKVSENEKQIGAFIAELIEDRSTLNLGAGVVKTRTHAHYVVTEFGVAYLYGKNLS